MTDTEDEQKIYQRKMDALAAKHLHQKRLDGLKRQSTFVDCLAFAVPALYFPIRYILKGTGYQTIAENIWEGLAALLTIFALIKVFYKWQERAEKHSRLRDENIFAGTSADSLLRKKGQLDERDIEHFYALMDRLEAEDREAMLKIQPKERQEAYREALKEISPKSPVCPICGASAWQFTPGNCQLCGNTPAAAPKSATERKDA